MEAQFPVRASRRVSEPFMLVGIVHFWWNEKGKETKEGIHSFLLSRSLSGSVSIHVSNYFMSCFEGVMSYHLEGRGHLFPFHLYSCYIINLPVSLECMLNNYWPIPTTAKGRHFWCLLRSWFWNINLNPSLGSVFFSCNEIMSHWNHLSDDIILLFFCFEKLSYLILHSRNGISIAGSLLSIQPSISHLSQPSPSAFIQRSSAGHSPEHSRC